MTLLERAFVAVVPPDAALDELEAMVRALNGEPSPLRWLPRQQWHLTLAFLGAVDDTESLITSLDAAVRASAPFTLQLGGGGAFPNPGRASVLWVGVAAGAPQLTALAAAVGAATAGLAHHTEHRSYHPHLTLARAARRRRLDALVDRFGVAPIGPAWTVTDVALVESDTRPDGAVHTVRGRVPLDGA